jgi:hypothetical protein
LNIDDIYSNYKKTNVIKREVINPPKINDVKILLVFVVTNVVSKLIDNAVIAPEVKIQKLLCM